MTSAGAAFAQAEVGRAVQDPLSRVTRFGLEQEVSGFDLPIARGTRYTLAPRADWTATRSMSLRMRAPVHWLRLAGSGTRAGVGDAELRIKFRLLEVGGYILVQAGVIETLPTGSPSRGLGNGALVLTPFLTGGRKFGKTILYGYVSDAYTLRNENARQYDDLTDPSTNHETRNAVGVITGPYGPIQANASLAATTILTGGGIGDTFLYGATIVAYAPSDSFRIQLGAQLPIAGDKRFDWKGTLDLYVFL